MIKKIIKLFWCLMICLFISSCTVYETYPTNRTYYGYRTYYYKPYRVHKHRVHKHREKHKYRHHKHVPTIKHRRRK